MNRITRDAFVLLKLVFILFLTIMMAGIGQCERRIDHKPGEFVRSTQGEEYPNRKVIVFVHGFTGDRDATWTYTGKSGTAYWPKIVTADPDLDSFDVYVASYFSKALKPGKTIHELGADLNFDLQQRGVFGSYDKITFVAHSMGNLVIREAMLDSKIYDDVRVRLIVSLGAPSHGSEIAKICSMVLSNQQCQDMIPEDHNTWLQSVNDRWRSMYPDLEIACAYETLDTPGVGGRLVDRGSATSFCSRMPPKAVGASHSEMVKPKGLTDETHAWLKQQLLAKPEKIAPYTVVLVDSGIPELVYKIDEAPEGSRNMHFIKKGLEAQQLPLDFHKVPIHDNWQDYDEVLRYKPDLVIVHFSSLYGKTSLRDPKGRLRTFLLRVLRNSKAKIIVYSRWNEQYLLDDGTKLGRMDEFLAKKLGEDGSQYRPRLIMFDVNTVDVQNPDFSKAVVIDKLGELVRQALDLPEGNV